jgi:hypothetical protein
MSITERVREWLEQHRGKSFCDACIATQLGLKGRRAVWRASKILARTSGFHREKSSCPDCHANRLVIRAV